MGRKAFCIWFIIYVLFFAALMVYYSLPVLMALVLAVLFSNIIGIIFAVISCYQALADLWLYAFDQSKWFSEHSHMIGMPDFSFESIIVNDCMALIVVLFFALHFFLCARRCKSLGASTWMILVPVYNPFHMFFNKIE